MKAATTKSKIKYTKEYDKLGPRVDIIFPLVDPDLQDEEQRNQAH